VAEGGGGVVVSLAAWPASPVRVATLGRSDLLVDRVWSLLGQDVKEGWPVEQAEAVDQAGRAVAQDGRSLQATVGTVSVRACWAAEGSVLATQEAIRMIAVAALLGDQLSEAAVMIGGAGGVLMHGAVLASGNVLQAIFGEDPDAGRLLQQDGGVAQDQAVDGLGLLPADRDGCRRAAGVPRSQMSAWRAATSVIARARLSAGLWSA
jgi:hypothetical protein